MIVFIISKPLLNSLNSLRKKAQTLKTTNLFLKMKSLKYSFVQLYAELVSLKDFLKPWRNGVRPNKNYGFWCSKKLCFLRTLTTRSGVKPDVQLYAGLVLVKLFLKDWRRWCNLVAYGTVAPLVRVQTTISLVDDEGWRKASRRNVLKVPVAAPFSFFHHHS